ncbi:MAG: hypothetical protein WC975_04000 [Phycisphaerae bacterium]
MKFEILKEPIWPINFSNFEICSAYEAAIQIVESNFSEVSFGHLFSLIDVGGGKSGPYIQTTPTWRLLSEKQKSYIEGDTTKYRYNSYSRTIKKLGRKYSQDIREYFIYVMSEKDAAVLAYALVNDINGHRRKNWEEKQENLKKEQKSVTYYKAEIPRLEMKLKKMKIEIEALQKIFHYTNPELAYSEFVEMDKLVRLINIDLAGLNARISATKKFSNDPKQGQLQEFYRLSNEQDVELAGLLARKKAVEDDRDQAKKYYDLLKQVESDQKTLSGMKAGLVYTKDNIKRTENILANPPEDMTPVTVVDNKVVIHPIKQPETKPAGGK